MPGLGNDPTNEELQDLSLACQRLWDLDRRLEAGRDYRINLQAGKKAYNKEDAAREPFFTYVNDQAVGSGTFRLFRALLDNYTRATGTAEKLTAQQEDEITAFLDAVMGTAPMTYVHKYLAAKDMVARDPRDFKKQLYQMWFRLYTRQVRDDTCGFEHVFAGEIEGEEVKGLHNWVRFYEEERAGNLDYRGFILPRGRGGGQAEQDESEQLLSLQFTWFGKLKEVTSFFIGTTPEFELALYTLCFVGGQEENIVSIGDYEVKIRAYQIHSKYGAKVGSCFPELISKVPGRHISQAPSQGGAYAPPGPQHQGDPDPTSNPQQQPGWYHQPSPAWQGQQGHPQQGYNPQQGSQYPQQGSQPPSAQQGCGDVLKALLDVVLSLFNKKK